MSKKTKTTAGANADIIDLGKIAKKIGTATATGGGAAVVDMSAAKPESTSGKKASSALKGDTSSKNRDTSAVRDYAAAKGYSGAVDWDGENAIVGGVKITPTEVKNGTAYADTDEIDDAISEMETRAGVVDSDSLRADYDDYIGDSLRTASGNITKLDAFSYDPDEDPAFAAYKRKYTEAAETALRRILNDNNASVTGASGAVLSEAMAAYYKNIRALTDMIPTLQANAYDRYRGSAELRAENASVLGEIADEYYDNIYGTQRERIDSLNSANAAERAEQQRWTENARADEELELKRAEAERAAVSDYYDNALDAQELERGQIELDYLPDSEEARIRGQELENERAEFDNTVAAAKERGFFTRADEAALPWLSAYRTGYNSYSVSPWEAEARYEYDIEHAKKLADFNASWGM